MLFDGSLQTSKVSFPNQRQNRLCERSSDGSPEVPGKEDFLLPGEQGGVLAHGGQMKCALAGEEAGVFDPDQARGFPFDNLDDISRRKGADPGEDLHDDALAFAQFPVEINPLGICHPVDMIFEVGKFVPRLGDRNPQRDGYADLHALIIVCE